MQSNSKNISMHILHNSALFAGISEEELAGLYNVLQPELRVYTKDNIVINEGDAAKQIGFVISGRIAARKLTDSGQGHILAVHEAGNDFGLDATFSTHRISPLTFTAETDCTALFISMSSIFDPLNVISIRIMLNANRIMADKCLRLLDKTEVLSKRSLRERIMAYLHIMQKNSGSNSFNINMSREQLAQYLCVNRSALSRELGRMQNDGLIKMTHSGHLTIGKI